MANTEFEICGVNHVALVCRDMAKTVEFYRDVLGMPLVKTLDLPDGKSQHFFFDIGNGDCLAFFWFADAPNSEPGRTNAADLPGQGNFHTANGSMNHLAFNVPADKFEEYYEKLKAKGVAVGPLMNHDNSPAQVSPEFTKDVYVRSIYFKGPDGELLEFACWTHNGFTKADLAHDPRRADGTKAVGLVTEPA